MRLLFAACLFSAVGLAWSRSASDSIVQKRAVPAGFATTNGLTFELDGEPFVSRLAIFISRGNSDPGSRNSSEQMPS